MTEQAATQATEPASVRDQLVNAIREAACDGSCGQTVEECAKERIQPLVWHHGKLALVEGSPEMFADAVLSVIQRLKAEVAAARKFAGEMRECCSPHGVATDYADRLIEAMDRAKNQGAGRDW